MLIQRVKETKSTTLLKEAAFAIHLKEVTQSSEGTFC